MSSQYGQDRFVLDVLGGRRDGFFLDSGAADGVEGSNTLLLERAYGWRGVCVEPNTEFFAELARNRHCHCVNCCLYDRDGSVAFVEAGSLGGIVDEYDPAMRALARATYGELPTVDKTTRTLRSVLRECGAPRLIDYWSLDTEGSELTILRSFPYDEYDFRVLTVEHNWLPARADIRRFLEGRGYRWLREMGCDDCYVNERLGSPAAWRSAAWRRGRSQPGRGVGRR